MTSCEIGMVQNNPLKGIDKARSRKMKPITVLTPDQAENLLRCASPKIIPFFAIGMFAGLRIDEIMKLDWKHINLVSRKIDLTWLTTKTQRLQAYGTGRIMLLVTRTSATGLSFRIASSEISSVFMTRNIFVLREESLPLAAGPGVS